tara:strand:- start:29 stop:232 length:204 start_codon:yes stop_codon:yes gene_type:complete
MMWGVLGILLVVEELEMKTVLIHSSRAVMEVVESVVKVVVLVRQTQVVVVEVIHIQRQLQIMLVDQE